MDKSGFLGALGLLGIAMILLQPPSARNQFLPNQLQSVALTTSIECKPALQESDDKVTVRT